MIEQIEKIVLIYFYQDNKNYQIEEINFDKFEKIEFDSKESFTREDNKHNSGKSHYFLFQAKV